MLQPRELNNVTVRAYDFLGADSSNLGFDLLHTRGLDSFAEKNYVLTGGATVYDISSWSNNPNGFLPAYLGTNGMARKYVLIRFIYFEPALCWDAGTLYQGAQPSLQPCKDLSANTGASQHCSHEFR